MKSWLKYTLTAVLAFGMTGLAFAETADSPVSIKRSRVGAISFLNNTAMDESATKYSDSDVSNIHLARIQVDSNSLTGFRVNVRFTYGEMSLGSDSTGALEASTVGTRAQYTWNFLETPAASATGEDVLGTASPSYPTDLAPNTSVGTNIDFNSSITKATYKEFDIQLSISQAEMKKLLTKTGFSYKEGVTVVLSDL